MFDRETVTVDPRLPDEFFADPEALEENTQEVIVQWMNGNHHSEETNVTCQPRF